MAKQISNHFTEKDKQFFKKLFDNLNQDNKFSDYDFKKPDKKPTRSKKYYIGQTIEIFCRYYQDFDTDVINADFKEVYSNITTHDQVLILDDQFILKELYAILFHVYLVQSQLKLINSPEYPEKYFAKYDQDNRYIERQNKKLKDDIFDPKYNMPVSKFDKFKWKLSTLRKKDPKLFEYYLNCIIIGHDYIPELADEYNVTEEDIQMITEMFNYYTTKKTTSNVIKKSLWILIYTKLRFYLHHTATESEQRTYHLMNSMYGYQLKSIEHKVYIKSIVNSLPVFGSKRVSHYSLDQIAFIEKQFKKESDLSEQNDINLFKIVKKLVEDQHKIYLLNYPIELFEKKSQKTT